MLGAGTLSPTTASMLAKRLTPANHVELLAAAGGKGKRDVQKVLARFFPEPDVPASVRKIRTASRGAVFPGAEPVLAVIPLAATPAATVSPPEGTPP
jgi:hypothetical protein